MTSTQTETVNRILQELDDTPEHRFGERFVRDRQYRKHQANLDAGSLSAMTFTNLVTADEFSSRMRNRELATRAVDSTALESHVRDVNREPLAADVPALIETVPVGERTVKVVDESVTEPSGTLGLDPASDPDTDAVYREFDLAYTATQEDLVRWATFTTIDAASLQDERLARRFIDRVATSLVERSLEDDVLNGDGSSANGRTRLDGVLNDPNINTYARDTANGEDRLSALAEAVRLIQNGGNYGNLTALGHPDTHHALRTDVDADGEYIAEALGDVVPDITRWLPSEFLPVGTVLVGDYDAGSTLYLRNGFTLAFSRSDSDYFLRDWVSARMRSRVFHHVARPSAFCELTSM